MGNVDYIRHTYTIVKSLKTYDVYSLIKVQNGTPQLTEMLRIEEFRNYSNATGIKDYLRLRTCSNWQRCEKVTGLRPTKRTGIFYGDRCKADHNKSLLLFTFNEDRSVLTVDYFRSFYPFKKGQLLRIIAEHQIPKGIKKGGVQPSLFMFKCETGNVSQHKNNNS